MPGDGDLNSDDYVAKLLAEDAKRCSLKYASAGLSAFLPATSRRPGPKPNTRFLSHLVRDVDSHNSALKRKEEQDARARIESYRKEEREDERARALDLAHTRRRKHREHCDEDRESSRKRRRGSSSVEHERGKDRHRSHRRREEAPSKSEDERPRSKPIGDHKHDKRSRRDEDLKQRRQASSPNPGSIDASQDRQFRGQSPRATSAAPRHNRNLARSVNLHSHNFDSESDSDPLEALIGPVPPSSTPTTNDATVRPRGRGAHTSHHPTTSSIDNHFSSTYDPTLDTGEPNFNESDDWDLALSALRDRTAWKQKQSSRLREAGFSEDEIRKWERNSTVAPGRDLGGDIEEVKWVKKGEDREWDLGKQPVVEDNDDNGSGVPRTGKSMAEHPHRAEQSRNRNGWDRKDGGLLKRFTSSLKHE